MVDIKMKAKMILPSNSDFWYNLIYAHMYTHAPQKCEIKNKENSMPVKKLNITV